MPIQALLERRNDYFPVRRRMENNSVNSANTCYSGELRLTAFYINRQTIIPLSKREYHAEMATFADWHAKKVKANSVKSTTNCAHI